MRAAWAALAPAAVQVPLAGVGFMPAGLGDGDLFRLNGFGRCNLNFRGVGDATGVGVGLGDTSAVLFLRIGLGVGEAAGDSAVDGDVALSAGGVASASFCVRCLVDEGDSLGVPVNNCD